MLDDVRFVELLTIIISCLFLLIGVSRDRKIHSPYVVFNFLWIFVCIMLVIGDSHIYRPSVSALLVILVGVIGFNLSVMLPRFTVNGKRIFIKEGPRTFLMDRCRGLAVALVFLWFFVSMDSILMLMSGSSLEGIRNNYYSDSSPVWIYYLKNYFLLPGTDAVIVASIISFIKQEKGSKPLLALAGILVLLRAVSSGGRYILINTLIMVLCALALFKTLAKLPWRKKASLYFVMALFAVLIIVFTNERTTANTENFSLFEKLYFTVYSYFAGSVTYLSRLMFAFPQIEGATFGTSFIGGLLTPIFSVLTFLNVMPYPEFMNVIGIYANMQLDIGPSTFYNAMPTVFGYFWIDGGLIAVFLESLLLGYICNRTYRIAQSDNQLFKAFYILLFVQICMVSTRWFFFTPDSLLSFAYLLFLFRVSDGDLLATADGVHSAGDSAAYRNKIR